jgi:protein-disulfide isomerase
VSDEIKSTNEIGATSALPQNIILAVVIAGVAAAVWFGFAPKTTTRASASPPIKLEGLTTSLAGIPTKGSPAAKVVVIEFSDFQCPFCAGFATGAQQELVAKYVDVGTVAWAFRHLPLSQIHPQAVKAAEAAECAGRQGRFWEAHDALFRDREALATRPASSLVQPVVSDSAAVAACVDNGQARERIVADAKEANRLGFRTTPVFVLGTRQPDGTVRIATALAGARSAAEFGRALDALVAH